jgi:hypothetical protein
MFNFVKLNIYAVTSDLSSTHGYESMLRSYAPPAVRDSEVFLTSICACSGVTYFSTETSLFKRCDIGELLYTITMAKA